MIFIESFEPNLLSFNTVKNFILNGRFDKATTDMVNSLGYAAIYDILSDAQFAFKFTYFTDGIFMLFDNHTFPSVIYGAIPVIKGNVEIFSYSLVDFKSYKFAKYMKRFVSYLDAIKEVKRIQSTIIFGNVGACRLHEKLGFKQEGILNKYDGENNYYMYARIK